MILIYGYCLKKKNNNNCVFSGKVEEIAIEALKSKDFPQNTNVLWYQDLVLNDPNITHSILNRKFSPFPGVRFR